MRAQGRISALAAALVFLAGIGMARAQAPQPGDADGDGLITTRDAGVATNQILGLSAAPGNPDCNVDQSVNVLDVLCIVSQFPTQLIESSPTNGEQDVALTRETILRFSNPLEAATMNAAAVKAEFGGQTLAARLYLSKDRKTVTLFYDAALPASGRIRVTVDGVLLKDERNRAVDADLDFAPGGIARIDFDTLTLSTVPGTAVCGRVFASELAQGSRGSVNVPLEGATITVDGAEQTMRAVTDANGNFRLEPAPAGRFFVHVDGRTATNGVPEGSYYPFVGKAWDSAPGKETNVGNIYLPLVPPGTLRPTSAAQDTVAEFVPGILAEHPEFEGVSVTVPADSLFADDGTRGGMVGIAPVPPDRLPGQLPPGLEFPLVITVQTDGATNFDRPAPACFPNLPEPATGFVPPAGTKNALFSFNHDTGHFEAVGPMTVTADERLVCTDPGAGILAPGWHGTGPPPVGPPPPPLPPDCPSCQPSSGRGGPIQVPPVCIRVGPEDVPCEQFCKLPLPESRREWSRYHHCIAEAIEDTDLCFKIAAAACIATLARSCREAIGCGIILTGCLLAETACAKQASVKAERCRDRHGCPHPDDLPRSLEPSSAATPFGLRSGDDPILDQIQQRLQQIYDLHYPFTATGERIPTDPGDQILALLNEIDNLAGGDAAQYMNRSIEQSESEIAQFEATIGERAGNAPAYPVRYLAEILRSDGSLLHLRSETGSFGRYNLFIPRDGSLMYVHLYDPRAKAFASVHPHLRRDTRFRLPRFTLAPVDDSFPDFDSDGLPDLVEVVFGTQMGTPDTDGDGVPDGAEVDQGTNPLDGRIAQTGIIATADTPGSAVDVCAVNDLVAVADSTAGVSVFNVFNGMSPTIVAQVDTPGAAKAVACAGSRIAVADGSMGLAVLDISDPPAASIVHQVPLGGDSQAVAAAGNLAFVSSGNELVLVDLPSGQVLDHRRYGTEPIHDLSAAGDFIYTLSATIGTSGRHVLHKIRVDARLGPAVASITVPGTAHPTFGRMRLFAGGGFVYVGAADVSATNQVPGVEVFSDTEEGFSLVGDPSAITAFDVAVNGSGLALFTGADAGLENSARVGLLDVRDPALTDRFLTAFETPGAAAAIALYNGLAYVADRSAGMQVINYLAYDALGVPPAVALSASFPLGPAQAEEGKLVRVTAAVSDDVQVRNVEFYVDGLKVATDGNFPFEHRFVTPLRSQQASFRLRARASDTGGNAAWSPEVLVPLVPDATPPFVVGTLPLPGAIAGSIDTLVAAFNEPLDPSTLDGNSFALYAAGPDGAVGTADDVPAAGGSISFRPEVNAAVRSFPQSLAPGLYRAVLRPPIADLRGNRIEADFAWTFRALSGSDRDQDGVLDDLEPVLGLDPDNPDTDGDGLRDGDEDFDGDGLSNAGEAVLGTDPSRADTDGDGISDGDEDPDGDGLSNAEEIQRGTDPLRPDTDLDGWSDALEVQAGSDPLDPGSRPQQVFVTRPPTAVLLPSAGANPPPNVTAARPPAFVLLPASGAEPPPNTTAARPPVRVEFEPAP
jgi:hypothetical protein